MEQGNVSPVPVAGSNPRPAPVPSSSISGGGRPLPLAPSAQAAPASEPVEVSFEEALAIAEELNRRVDFNKFQAQVRLDEASNRFVFQIHSRENGKLIRQFPPEGILFLARRLHSAGLSGFLLDDQV